MMQIIYAYHLKTVKIQREWSKNLVQVVFDGIDEIIHIWKTNYIGLPPATSTYSWPIFTK